MFQPVNLSCYDKSQQAQGKLPVCQYWHEEDTLSDMTDIKYYDQKYLKQLMNGLDFVLRVFSKKESSESALVFVYDKVTNLYNLRQLGCSGGKDYSKEIESLENAVSVLTTSVELSTEIGQTTTVLLDELLTLGVDGRPDYKTPGATVYAENGVTGIIDTIDNSMQTATIKTVSVSISTVLHDKTSDITVLQFGDKVIQSGVITIGVVNPKVANSNNPVSLTVAMDMTTPYTIICTPSNTAEAFDRLIADYGNQTANGFEICVRNLSEDTAAANVVVSWMVIGKVSG